MKMKRFSIVLGLLLLLFIPAGTALAAPPFDTIVATGETIPNDIVVFDGDVEVEEGATVKGSITVFNGNATIAGTVMGDLVLFNGNLDAASTAELTGDCVLLNGNLTDDTESGLGCTDFEGAPTFIPAALASLSELGDFTDFPGQARTEVTVTPPSPTNRFFTNLAEAVGSSLLLGFLAFVVASLLPEHLQRVEDTVQQKPVASGTVGLLTAVAVPSLVALLLPVSIILTLVCIGLLGFPIMFALMFGLAAGSLLGWVVVGYMVGKRLAGPLKLKSPTLPVTAALGTALLTFVIGLMGLGEGVITFLVVCVGLGATTLTKFGTRTYPEVMPENEAKVAAVLETLTVDDSDLKNSDE